MGNSQKIRHRRRRRQRILQQDFQAWLMRHPREQQKLTSAQRAVSVPQKFREMCRQQYPHASIKESQS